MILSAGVIVTVYVWTWVRSQSEFDEKPVAYGVYFSAIRFETRGAEEQILHRRQHQGARYPVSSDGTRSKLATLENVSIYCDTNTESYFGEDVYTAEADDKRILEAFREKARRAFVPDSLRDMFFASVIWIKLDLSKKNAPASGADGEVPANENAGGFALSAIDFVTEALKINFDFAQLSAMNEELTRLSNFRRQTQVRQWRPSCIDRKQVEPPVVCVANTALMPIITADDALALSFPPEKQMRSTRWLREMWRFATWCVLVRKRNGNPNLLRFTLHKRGDATLDDDARARRYADLYARNLTSEALQMIIYGKKLLWTPASPRRSMESQQLQDDQTTTLSLPFLPTLEPLTREEQWELSDMVVELAVPEQRKYRSIAEASLRSLKTNASVDHSPPAQLGVELSNAYAPSQPLTPSLTIAEPAAIQNVTPIPAPMAASPSQTCTRLPEHSTDLANSHNRHHLTRSLTESAVQPKLPHIAPKLSQLHFASTSSLPLPLKVDAGGELGPTKARTPASPGILKQAWVQQAFIPAWILKKCLPLMNWSIGPISLCIFRDTSQAKSDGYGFSTGETEHKESGEAARCEFLKIGFERCTGAILICSPPAPSFLVELRLGLFHATLFSPSHQRAMNGTTRNNSVSSGYIKDPDDGFFYVGLRYSCVKTGTLVSGGTEREWDIKGKVCVGPLMIDYNELTLQTTLATTVGIPLSGTSTNNSHKLFLLSWGELLVS
ncbi:hypothetical protein PybrP1_006873 [[Pythium] brassicae (nom. inval.)]|nr:hypothetical protein PybrP1_006873 [[Pythium] brassicae (nom. inval.)]